MKRKLRKLAVRFVYKLGWMKGYLSARKKK